MSGKALVVMFVFSVTFNGVFGNPLPDLEEGAICGDYENSTYREVCKKVTECAPAMEELKDGRFPSFQRCGFDGFIEILCCPESELEYWIQTTTSTSTEETTEQTTSTTTEAVSKKSNKSPVVDNRELTAAKRKSLLACEEYSNEVPTGVSYQILGGTNARPGEFPHMVALGYDSMKGLEWNCGGTLISDRYVLTAAHCVIAFRRDPPIKARLGTIDLSDATVSDYKIVNITIHPMYSYIKRVNDIALVELDRKVVNSKEVRPACLYSKEDDPPILTITGWGITETGNASKILQKAVVEPVATAECNTLYTSRINKQINSTHVCAKASIGYKIDTCGGDSGGPLQTDQEYSSGIISVVGVTSYGLGCGSPSPGVYARVYSYLDWIESIVWP